MHGFYFSLRQIYTRSTLPAESCYLIMTWHSLFLTLVVVTAVSGNDVQLLSQATSDFSQQLYQELVTSTSSIIYSPYSIFSALGMTLAGARANTAREISRTLRLTSLTAPASFQAFRDVIFQLKDATNVDLLTANGIFLNPSIPIEPQFVSLVQNQFLATSANLDFNAPGGPEKAVNNFVDQNTRGKIKDIIAAGSIDGSTVAVLVNAIFFNGTWDSPFESYRTRKQNFNKLDGTTSKVDMMKGDKHINIKKNVDGVDVAEIPFKGKRFSLYIVLPQSTEGITALESSLTTPGKVDQLLEGLTPTFTRLRIPKFKVETTLKLVPTLQQMGILDAFDPNKADFSGLSSTADVYVSDVVHKATIEVLETGTVAAAASAVFLRGKSAMRKSPKDTFTADHPFVYILKDRQTHQILFQGRFMG